MGAPGARIRRPESGKNKMRIAVSIAAPAAGGAGTLDAGARASAFTAGGKSERADSGKRGKRVSPRPFWKKQRRSVVSACGLRKASGADPSGLLPPRHAKKTLACRGPRYSRPDENGRSLYGHSG